MPGSDVILVCPACRTPVANHRTRYVCTNANCRLAYAIADDIPNFLVPDAERLPAERWKELPANTNSH